MKTKLTLAITIFLCSALNAFAIDENQIRASFNMNPSPNACVELITECFALGDEEKGLCFKDSAENLFCKKIALSKLAEKRGSFLTINKGCIENFDNLFSAKLLQGKIHEQEVNKLSATLESCRTETPIELNRQ